MKNFTTTRKNIKYTITKLTKMCITQLKQLQNSTKDIKEDFSKWRDILQKV